MIDSHCHLDLYPYPMAVARSADKAGVLTICVTNLPSAFVQAQAHLRIVKHVRVALGLHPLQAAQHLRERAHFRQLITSTSYIGEIGLDFSREGQATRNTQLESFEFVLQSLQGKPKFVSLHSRRAERTVVDMLMQADRSPVVFHWYSGSLDVLERALADGHYFSVNPSMTKSQNGQKIIARLPTNRVLTETDGPFITLDGRAVVPQDVRHVEAYLAKLWKKSADDISLQIRANLLDLLRPLQTSAETAAV